MINIFRIIRNNKTILNGGLFSIYSFINQGSNFLLLIVLAGIILPEDYGHLSLFNTSLALISYVTAFGSAGYMCVSYFKNINNRKEFREDFTSIVFLLIISIMLFSFLISFCNTFFSFDIGFSQHLLWYTIVLAFFTAIVNLYLDYYRVQEKVLNYGLVSCSNALFNFIFTLLFVMMLNHGWVGRIEAQVLCYVLFGLFGICFFKNKNMLIMDLSLKRIKTILLWGLPLIPHHISIWLRQGCDRFIINYYHSVYDVGLFSFSLNLVSIIILIGMAYNQTNSVSIYKNLSCNKSPVEKMNQIQRQTKELYIIIIFSSLLVIGLVSIFIPLIIPKYIGSISYFLFLSVYGLLQCIYFLYCNYLFYYEKTKILMQITFCTSLLHLTLSLILTRYSLYYTCIIYILTQLIIDALVYYMSKKVLLTFLNKV